MRIIDIISLLQTYSAWFFMLTFYFGGAVAQMLNHQEPESFLHKALFLIGITIGLTLIATGCHVLLYMVIKEAMFNINFYTSVYTFISENILHSYYVPVDYFSALVNLPHIKPKHVGLAPMFDLII